jgi:hypothetical protein
LGFGFLVVDLLSNCGGKWSGLKINFENQNYLEGSSLGLLE